MSLYILESASLLADFGSKLPDSKWVSPVGSYYLRKQDDVKAEAMFEQANQASASR